MSGLVAIRTSPLSIDEAVSAVRRESAGAIAIFIGTVRDHNRDQPVSLLEYAAYDSMAIKEMAKIIDEISSGQPGTVLAVLHRTGTLQIGDMAVICAASAPHRDEAFRACRAAIDRIKERVPIWKREHGPGGAHWVDWHDAPAEQPLSK